MQGGYSHLRYNVDGHLVEARDEAKNRSLRYVNNAQGLVLKREEIASGSTYKRQDYYYLDGKQIGAVASVGYGTLRGLVSGGIQSQVNGQRPNWGRL
ncbi:hypothetical protein, partial [Chromobacterium aquaticum]